MRKKWLLAFALLPLVGLPLVAQEPDAADSGAADQEHAPATQDEPAPAGGKQEPASAERPEPPEERVSADNNLSFPADI